MYTKEELQNKTVVELRQICVHTLEIPGMTKKRKDIIIEAILKNTRSIKKKITTKTQNNKVTGLDGSFTSSLTNPNASFGNKTKTTIQVSAGASSGKFPVVGKSVGVVSEFLREVLNVARMSKGLVNGKEVLDGYVLKDGDILEFIKPAGKKG